jgi:putative RecB family exonuclease
MASTLPRSLSPTRLTSFTDCPLAFRLRSIDRLPEPPSPHKAKGTLVHRALERLIWEHPPAQRTPAVAAAELDMAWQELQDDPELADLGLTGAEATAFHGDAAALVQNYFVLEAPQKVHAVGVEVMLEADLDGVALRGIIDRLDMNERGELVVIDYKTGRAPGVRYEKSKLAGVHLYALLCERALGVIPVEVRLLHLREPLTISASPTAQTLRGQRQRTLAVWQAIERACDQGDFQPRPSGLCSFCNFQQWCPAHGGTPPVFPLSSSDRTEGAGRRAQVRRTASAQ